MTSYTGQTLGTFADQDLNTNSNVTFGSVASQIYTVGNNVGQPLYTLPFGDAGEENDVMFRTSTPGEVVWGPVGDAIIPDDLEAKSYSVKDSTDEDRWRWIAPGVGGEELKLERNLDGISFVPATTVQEGDLGYDLVQNGSVNAKQMLTTEARLRKTDVSLPTWATGVQGVDNQLRFYSSTDGFVSNKVTQLYVKPDTNLVVMQNAEVDNIDGFKADFVTLDVDQSDTLGSKTLPTSGNWDFTDVAPNINPVTPTSFTLNAGYSTSALVRTTQPLYLDWFNANTSSYSVDFDMDIFIGGSVNAQCFFGIMTSKPYTKNVAPLQFAPYYSSGFYGAVINAGPTSVVIENGVITGTGGGVGVTTSPTISIRLVNQFGGLRLNITDPVTPILLASIALPSNDSSAYYACFGSPSTTPVNSGFRVTLGASSITGAPLGLFQANQEYNFKQPGIKSTSGTGGVATVALAERSGAYALETQHLIANDRFSFGRNQFPDLPLVPSAPSYFENGSQSFPNTTGSSTIITATPLGGPPARGFRGIPATCPLRVGQVLTFRVTGLVDTSNVSSTLVVFVNFWGVRVAAPQPNLFNIQAPMTNKWFEIVGEVRVIRIDPFTSTYYVLSNGRFSYESTPNNSGQNTFEGVGLRPTDPVTGTAIVQPTSLVDKVLDVGFQFDAADASASTGFEVHSIECAFADAP